MKTWSYKINSRNLDLYGIGDFHVGSENCDEKAIEKAVKIVKQNRNAKFIFMGDGAEFIPPSGDKRFSTENIAERYRANPIENQLIRLKELLLPIAKKCVGYISGNHEEVISRKIGYNFARRFAEDVLETEYLGFASLTKLKFNNGKALDVFVTHGSGSARTLSGKKRKLWNLKNIAKSDLYMMGHYHNMIITNDIERREHRGGATNGVLFNNDSKIGWEKVEKAPWYVMTSSFYKTYQEGVSSYGERALYQPLKIGMVEIQIRNGIITDAQEIYLD